VEAGLLGELPVLAGQLVTPYMIWSEPSGSSSWQRASSPGARASGTVLVSSRLRSGPWKRAPASEI
jgi:hypothetical protein